MEKITHKPIRGFENLYSVTREGAVFSQRKGDYLVLQEHRAGYLYVYLSKNGKRAKKYIHRLVLETFLGPSNMDVNHIDGDKKNNNIVNLEFVTHAENMRHAKMRGVMKKPKGENSVNSKLTDHEVKVIKELLFPIFSNVEIAEMYCVNQSTIARIRTQKNWSHI